MYSLAQYQVIEDALILERFIGAASKSREVTLELISENLKNFVPLAAFKSRFDEGTCGYEQCFLLLPK